MAFLGSCIVIITECIKHCIGKKSTRPKGATDCNIFCNNGDVSGQPGMPSGHSFGAAFFSGFYCQQTNNIWIQFILIIYAILIMISRYIKKCHTIGQIGAGGTIGLIFSWIVNRIGAPFMSA